jgi:hypothetical protein
MLMLFVSAVHNKTATKHWTANIKTIKCADIATCFANGGTQTPKGAGHIVELAIKSNGKCGVGESRHMTLYATDSASA